MKVKEFFVLIIHAFVGWALCGAIMGIGLAVTSLETTLIIHAIGAPIIFIILSLIYFRKFHYTTPLQTAAIFVGFVIFMDVFIVALFMNKSFEMFASILGTWIPIALIFISTYLVGVFFLKKNHY